MSRTKARDDGGAFARRLALLMQWQGYTYLQLSLATGIAVSTLHRWVHGTTVPSGSALSPLVSIFQGEVSVEYLLDGVVRKVYDRLLAEHLGEVPE